MVTDKEEPRRPKRKMPVKWWSLNFINSLRMAEETVDLPDEDWHDNSGDDDDDSPDAG
jgi:hypothetical protein